MGALTSEQPKCMTEIKPGETILSRQLKQLIDFGITEAVITTGYCESVLMNYCAGLDLPISIKFVHNPQFRTTNYIYSIYLARESLDDDILLMHGDLVFENEALSKILESDSSVMAVSSTVPLPEKDFKAVIDDTGKILKVGVEFFSSAITAQPLYKLNKHDWNLWLSKINEYCVEILKGGGGTNLLRRKSPQCSGWCLQYFRL